MENSGWHSYRLPTQIFPKNLHVGYIGMYLISLDFANYDFSTIEALWGGVITCSFKNIRTDCLYRTWPCVSITDQNDSLWPAIKQSIIYWLNCDFSFFNLSRKEVQRLKDRMKGIREFCITNIKVLKYCARWIKDVRFSNCTTSWISVFIYFNKFSFISSVNEGNTVYFYVNWL